MKVLFKENIVWMKIIIGTFFIPFIVFVVLYPLFLEESQFSKFATLSSYLIATNQPIYYYLPVVGVFLFLEGIIPLDYFQRRYIYKFKSKFILLKSNLKLTFKFTVFYVIVVNTVFLFLISLKTNGFGKKGVIVYVSTIVLQVLVLYIYSLINYITRYIFVKNITIANMIVKIGIITAGFMSALVPGFDLFRRISLYSYFNIQSLQQMNTTILINILLLLFVIYVLINILKFITNNSDYLKYLYIKE